MSRFRHLHTSSRIHWPVVGQAERAWPWEHGDFGVQGRDKGEVALTGAPARLCAAPRAGPASPPFSCRRCWDPGGRRVVPLGFRQTQTVRAPLMFQQEKQAGRETERSRHIGRAGRLVRLCPARGGGQGRVTREGENADRLGWGGRPAAASDGTIRESASETLRPESWTGAAGQGVWTERQRVDQASFGSGGGGGSPSTGVLCELVAQPPSTLPGPPPGSPP